MRCKRGWRVSVALVFVGFVLGACGILANRAFAGVLLKGGMTRDSTQTMYSELLREVVQSHPRSEVRDTLNTLIVDGAVMLNFEPGIAAGGAGDATILLVHIDGYGTVPVLNIDPSLFNSDHPAGYASRVLFHEYVLLQQLFHGSPAEYFEADTLGASATAEEVQTVFGNEVRAYCAECQLATDMQWPVDDVICDAYQRLGVVGVRHELVRFYMERPRYAAFRELLQRLAGDANMTKTSALRVQ